MKKSFLKHGSSTGIVEPKDNIILDPKNVFIRPDLNSGKDLVPFGGGNLPTDVVYIRTASTNSSSVVVKSGVVLDEFKQPLVNAHLLDLTDKYNGTSTSFYGDYDLTANSSADIQISHLGYKKQVIKAGSLPAEIILKQDVGNIDVVDLGVFTSKNNFMIPLILLIIAFLGLSKK